MAVAVLGTLSGISYYLLCIWSALKFLRGKHVDESASADAFVHPVSILKPLKGTDPGMYESFRSHCLQDYPEYEIIFGVSDPQDPAVPLVERLKTEFPQRSIHLLVCPQILGSNVKVSNLAQMVPVAKYDLLVVNDSDIQVSTDYLRQVITRLGDPQVGMVTCLYRGVAAPTLGSRLEAVGISTDFAGGVLAAQELEGGIRFGLGSTLAFRRRDLESIGGFEALVDYLADDYELGARLASLSLQVKLSPLVVETHLPAYSFRGFFEHQLRWARSVRASRAWGYFALILTLGILWALMGLLVSRGANWAWELLGVALVARLCMAVVVGRYVLEDRQIPSLLWLVPLRDLVALLVWLASYVGRTIHWRGDDFYLKDGKLARINS
ncbi:MAG TPA: bacteriohopanetetrol glucosamine biosynthesis glycosyltransferase HpnI [Terriglobales bacterium]|nr:bacteriohopanetetrol glucosamine biosynthesis glycosyltransferase HpnI [Terriglobales bacterium]